MTYHQKNLNFNIGGVQKCSLLDFPEKISAVVFTQGCNFRCRYCHNPELIEISQREERMLEKISEFFNFLKTRIGKLDGIVISGGEPTLQKDLKRFLKMIKELGFKTKLDTNGSNPNILEDLLRQGLVDYVAMDIKAPFQKYDTITDVKSDIGKIQKSTELILNSNIEYEFRTTTHSKLLQIEDFTRIAQKIKGARRYILQEFRAGTILDKDLCKSNYTESEFNKIMEILKKDIGEVSIR